LVGWFVCLLVGWLVGWLAVRLVGWLVGWLAGVFFLFNSILYINFSIHLLVGGTPRSSTTHPSPHSGPQGDFLKTPEVNNQ